MGGRLPVDGWWRKARQSPSGLASSASSPDGAPFARAKPARGASPSGEVAAKQAGGALGLAAGCPLTGGDAKPVKAPQASQTRPAPHCVGRLLRGRSPREKPPLTGEVAAKQAGRALGLAADDR